MRIRFCLTPKTEQEEVVLPLDFRRHFISLIKRLLKHSLFGQRFTEAAPGYSPYVFSTAFGRINRIVPEQEAMIIRPPVYMTFSTGLFDLMTHVCNRAIVMKDEETVLGLKLGQIQLLPLKTLGSGAVQFQLVGHAVLRGREDYVGNIEASHIEEAINTHLQTKLGFLSQSLPQINDSVYSPVKVLEHRGLTKGVCHHYGGKITSVRGNITLAGYPASLQFLYDYGLGVRTGQGFGLLEVMKQL